MEVDMEDDNSSGGDTAVEFTFTAVEIDIDYEFEAARFFDFTRTETIDEAREAEMWFESVGSYPPSPFAVRLLSRGKSENSNGSTVSKGFDNANQSDSGSDRAPDDSTMAMSNTDGDVANGGVRLDLKGYYLQASQKQHTNSFIPKDSTRNTNYNYKSKTKSSWKPSLPRTSTLMKPTASQLAKQNQERLIDHFRFQKPANTSSVVESQAAKRQKIEGGHLFKVTDTKQQTNFVHKAPKREGTLDGNLGHGRLRITVPRPPDLATAQRAHRIRQKGDNDNEHAASRASGFRARPLNRKIFEAPSSLHQKRSTPQLPEFQEFHLKTTERAVQNTAAVPSTSACCNNLKAPHKPSITFGTESSSRESKGSHVSGVPKQEDCETIPRFKALPLNKKIFSSKGDLGVFRSSKRETTVAMAFNFQTEKRAQHAPPVDLFNKLSLASESGSRASRPPSIFTKGSKENRVCSFQQQSAVNTPKPGSKQVHIANTITEGPPLSTISRNSGIR
ncbi:putative TPX2 central domain-containing protein [Helianthus debilis subsp. tardiflorus]